jgi:hypothetical protein
MKRLSLTGTAALTFLLCLTAGRAAAQPQIIRPVGPLPSTRPAYSPYLNLLRPGNPTFTNYYGLVRPEVAFRAGFQTVEQQNVANQEALTALETGANTVATGHKTRFLNTSGYFLSQGGGQITGITGGTGIATTAATATRPTSTAPRTR